MGKRKKGNCIFCLSRPATEKEHVFPRSWYPSTTPPSVQYVTAPVCDVCADEFEIAERKFSFPVLMGMDPSNPDVASVMDGLRRSWQFDKAPSIRESVYRAAKLKSIARQIKYVVRPPNTPAPWRLEVPVRTPAGLLVKASPALELDHEVAVKICEKFVRGLHYNETKVPLPIDTPILFQWLKRLAFDVRASIEQLPLNNLLAPGLRYRVRREDNCSFWVFYLWGQVEFVAFAGTPTPDSNKGLTGGSTE